MRTLIVRKFGRQPPKTLKYQPLKGLQTAMASQETPVIREARLRMFEHFNRKYGNQKDLDMTLMMKEFETMMDQEFERNPQLAQEMEKVANKMETHKVSHEGMRQSIELIEKLGEDDSRPKKN